MKYLAFDIEAANGYKPYSICSIGIVVANENFDIIFRDNIWINPKTKYNLNGTRKNVGIDLHLDKKLLDSSPEFAQVYDTISSYLTDPDTLVVGHAVDSDVRMLNAACAKNKLPSINFNFLCTQLLYKLYKGEKDVKALCKIAQDIGLSFHEHNSEDDAWMSMQTLKYLVQQTQCDVAQLMEQYAIRIGNNSNFEMSRCVTINGQASNKKMTKQLLDNLRNIANTTQPTSTQLSGMVLAIARSIEILEHEFAIQLVQKVVEKGGKYTTKLAKCNTYVLPETPIHQDNMRQRRAEELMLLDAIVVMTKQQIIDKVGL